MSRIYSDDETQPPVELIYSYQAHIRPNFPQDTQGFLYYHAPKWAPQLAGQLRFRITPSSDPATFSSGRDLTWRGLPWHKSLFSMSASQSKMLPQMLIRDGLVTEHLITTCKNRSLKNSTSIIYALHQPFCLHLNYVQNLYIINTSSGKETVDHVRVTFPTDANSGRLFRGLHGSYYCNLSKFNNYPSVGGSAVCRFELSQNNGKPIVVIRLVKILEDIVLSPDASNVPPMAEGDLLRGARKVWHYEIVDGEGSSSIRCDQRWALRCLKQYPEASFE